MKHSKLCLAQEWLNLDFLHWRWLSPLGLGEFGGKTLPLSLWVAVHRHAAWGPGHHSQVCLFLRSRLSSPSTTLTHQREGVTAPDTSRPSGHPRAVTPFSHLPAWLRQFWGERRTHLLSNRCFWAWIDDYSKCPGNFRAQCRGTLQCKKQTDRVIFWAVGFGHLSLNLSRLDPAQS